MAFCLLLLRPTARRYTVLPPLLPLLAVSVSVAVTVAVAVAIATISFAAVLS